MNQTVLRLQVAWDRRKVTMPKKNCLECHDVMFPMRSLSVARWRKRKFCRNECRARYYAKIKAEAYRKYQAEQKTKYCLGCKLMLVPRHNVSQWKRRKFCALVCRARYYSALKNNRWGTHNGL